MGSAAEFTSFTKRLAERSYGSYDPLRELVRPYILRRLKQICNHPSQWLGDGAWDEGDSGKWARLREIAEVIRAKQEKMLVDRQDSHRRPAGQDRNQSLLPAQPQAGGPLPTGGAGTGRKASGCQRDPAQRPGACVSDAVQASRSSAGNRSAGGVPRLPAHGIEAPAFARFVEGGADLLLTELKDDELLRLVMLDIHKALQEA